MIRGCVSGKMHELISVAEKMHWCRLCGSIRDMTKPTVAWIHPVIQTEQVKPKQEVVCEIESGS